MPDAAALPGVNFDGPIGLAFGNEDHTTGWHLHRALDALGLEVVVFGPGHRSLNCTRDIPVIWVDSGADWIPEPVMCGARSASLAWLIDTHRPGRWRRVMPQLFGAVGFAQRAAWLRAAHDDSEPERLAWIPLAAPIDLARPDDDLVRRPYDIAFVGQAPTGSRRALVFNALQRELTVAPAPGRVSPEQMMELYGSARIVLNIPLAGELNMRTFEAAASRAVLLCAPTSDLDRVLPNGSYVEVEIDDPAAWVRAAHGILADPASQSMADAACARVSSQHTYPHRASQLLGLLRPPVASTRTPRVAASIFAEWGQSEPIRNLQLGAIERAAAIGASKASRAARSVVNRFPVVKRLGHGPLF